MPRTARIPALLLAVLSAAALTAGCGQEKDDRRAPPLDQRAAPDPGNKRPRLFGFSDNAATAKLVTPARGADLMKGAGANAHRITFDWRWAEPRPDEYHFEIYDEIYRAELRRGIKPVFTILFAPSWALERGVTCNQYREDCTFPPGRAHDDQWREIVRKLAERYPRAGGFEIWNEPNLTYFWKPRPDAARYTELQRQAYREIKAAAPRVPVVAGGFNNIQSATGGHVPLADFVRGVYSAGGRESMDAIGVHPYPEGVDPDLMSRSLDQVREVMRSARDRRPLWVTEVGLSTTKGPELGTDEAGQAAGVPEAVRRLAAMHDVEAVFLFNLVDGHASSVPGSDGFGVLHADLRRKPAYCALAKLRGRGC